MLAPFPQSSASYFRDAERPRDALVLQCWSDCVATDYEILAHRRTDGAPIIRAPFSLTDADKRRAVSAGFAYGRWSAVCATAGRCHVYGWAVAE